MKVILGSDSDGKEVKKIIKKYLTEKGYEIIDVSENETKDFVETAYGVAQKVLKNEESLGIVFDGYGAGSFMTATKVKGIVAAEVSDERTAYMTRGHNNARLITVGVKIVGIEVIKNIVDGFLNGTYDGGRHQIRVDMLNKMC